MTSPSVAYAYADGSANTVRLENATYPNGRVLDYGYGSSGSVADQLSRIATLTHNGSQVAAYTYLGLSSFVRTDYTQPSVRWDLITGSGANPYAGLDAFGRVIDCLWNKYSSTAADLERIKYGYDRAGNRTWRYNSVAHTNSANFDELYSYDGLYQLAEMQRGSFSGTPPAGFGSQAFEQAWTLDPTGNWRGFQEKAAGTSVTLNQTRTANTVNEITGISNSVGGSWVQPAYDAAGNMTTMPQPAAPGSGYTAKYDAWNRLVKLVDPATSHTVQENAYDGLTRRTVQKSYTSGTLSETRHYYYSEAWQVLEERLGTSPSSASADRQFVWGLRYIDDLVLRDRSTSGTLDERLYALQDANWNVTALCDTSAAVQERYAYSAYGMPMFLTPTFGSRSSSSFDSETLYTGQQFNSSCGIFLFRIRHYHPCVGRFITTDPIKVFGGDPNFYCYVGNGPINATDPSGLEPLFVHGEIVPHFHLPDSRGVVLSNPRDPWSWPSGPGHYTTDASKLKDCSYSSIAGEYTLPLLGGFGAGIQITLGIVECPGCECVATVAVAYVVGSKGKGGSIVIKGQMSNLETIYDVGGTSYGISLATGIYLEGGYMSPTPVYVVGPNMTPEPRYKTYKGIGVGYGGFSALPVEFTAIIGKPYSCDGSMKDAFVGAFKQAVEASKALFKEAVEEKLRPKLVQDVALSVGKKMSETL